MTLPSLRNRQTTPPSIRRSKTFDAWTSLLALICVVGATSPLHAQQVAARNDSSSTGWTATRAQRAQAAIGRVAAEPAGRPAQVLPLTGPMTDYRQILGRGGQRVATSQDVQPGGELDPRLIPVPAQYESPSIESILPYADYEPARVAVQEQDCQTECPCAPGEDCRKPGGRRPCPCPEEDIKQPWITTEYTPRMFERSEFYWDASNVFHHPLYFEDFALERYGHTHCELIQPYFSIRRFGVQLALLPYQMTMKPPCERRYPLGFYRPGEWAPKLFYQIPLNAQAALVQGSVMTGAGFLFP